MKQIFTLFFLLLVFGATAQTTDSIRYDTIVVATRIFPDKPVSSFNSSSLKKSKVERAALRNRQ